MKKKIAVKKIGLFIRMAPKYVKQLDRLVRANKRDRRELIELLIEEEHLKLRDDPDHRINPR